MYFLNLETLKIDKTYNYQTIEEDLILQHKDSLMNIKEKSRLLCQNILEQTAMPTEYKINLVADMPESDEDAGAYFLSVVNVFNAMFFAAQCPDLNKRRPREYRLGVPDNFKPLSINVSLLKRVINFITLNNKFNITINWNDEYNYSLVPQSKEESEVELGDEKDVC